MSFIPGANVGPYRIVEQAERNGVATTYTAYQPSLGRYVSVVVVPAIDRDDVVAATPVSAPDRARPEPAPPQHPDRHRQRRAPGRAVRGDRDGRGRAACRTARGALAAGRGGAGAAPDRRGAGLRARARGRPRRRAAVVGAADAGRHPDPVRLRADDPPLAVPPESPTASPAARTSSAGGDRAGAAGRPARPRADRLRDADRPDDGRRCGRLRAAAAAGPDRQSAADAAGRARVPPRADRRSAATGTRAPRRSWTTLDRPGVDRPNGVPTAATAARPPPSCRHRWPAADESPPTDHGGPDLRGAGRARRAGDPAARR